MFVNSRKKIPVAGSLFKRFSTYKDLSGFDLIILDGVPDELSNSVQSIWNETIAKLTPDSDKSTLASMAHECSMALYDILPWEGISSGKSLDSMRNKDELTREFYKNYLKESPTFSPHLLTELCENDELHCIGQGFSLDLSIRDKNWQVYSKKDGTAEVTHHVFAGDYGAYMLEVEPVIGPRYVLKGTKSIEHTYAYNKSDFFKKYEATPFIFSSSSK